jgi:hypothetical protein
LITRELVEGAEIFVLEKPVKLAGFDNTIVEETSKSVSVRFRKKENRGFLTLNALVVEELPIDKNTKIQVGILVGTSDSFRMLSGSTTYSENGERKMETNYGIL